MKIINGDDAVAGQFDFMVALFMNVSAAWHKLALHLEARGLAVQAAGLPAVTAAVLDAAPARCML